MRVTLARHAPMVHDEAMPHTEEPLIGTAEAARILGGVSHRTVHRLVESGDLTPAMTAPGGRAGAFLFDRADVERLAKVRAA